MEGEMGGGGEGETVAVEGVGAEGGVQARRHGGTEGWGRRGGARVGAARDSEGGGGGERWGGGGGGGGGGEMGGTLSAEWVRSGGLSGRGGVGGAGRARIPSVRDIRELMRRAEEVGWLRGT